MADMNTERDRCERWFVRRGLPHLIEKYSATEDVLTRMVPLLSLVVFFELFMTFGDRWKGWAQFGAFTGGVFAMTTSFVVVNKLRGRRLLQLPDDVGLVEIGLYFALPMVPAAIGSESAVAVSMLEIVIVNFLILAVGYVVTSWGILSMLRWSLGQVRHQVGDITNLVMKSLPILLVFSAFIFLNAEMWQVANDFTLPFFGAVFVLVGGLMAAFVAVSVNRLTVDLARFEAWDDVRPRCVGSPVQDIVPLASDPAPASPPLGRSARFNVGLLLFTSQVIQIMIVGFIITVFYMVFGLAAVREDTLLQWTTATELTRSDDWAYYWSLFGGEVVFTRQLLLVSAFIGLVSALQFAIQVVTDSTYRAEFAADMTEEIRDALAVRAVYLRRFVMVTPG